MHAVLLSGLIAPAFARLAKESKDNANRAISAEPLLYFRLRQRLGPSEKDEELLTQISPSPTRGFFSDTNVY